jgi:hypothetical protein
MTKRNDATLDKGVSVVLPLFSKPGQELNEGAPLTPKQLRDLGPDPHARLDKAAGLVETLAGAGWDALMSLSHVDLYHPTISSEAQARDHLRQLGIDPEEVAIEEWEADTPEDPE